MTRPLVLWDDVPPDRRRTWRTHAGACAAAASSGWNDGTFAPCWGYVRPGRRFCWSHDPEVQTSDYRAAIGEKIAAGVRRSRQRDTQTANWVGEGWVP